MIGISTSPRTLWTANKSTGDSSLVAKAVTRLMRTLGSRKILLASYLLGGIGSLIGCGSGGNGGGIPPPTSTITSVAVSCSPTLINTTQKSTCTAQVNGTGSYSTGVTWTATDGAITTAGVLTPSGPGTSTVTATSTQDSTKSGSASVTVTSPPTITSVTVSCNPATVPEGQTSQCTATVQGTGNFDPTVTWMTSLGAIASTAKDAAAYTAPSSTTGTATVTATSSEDATQSGGASLAVVLSPPSATFHTAAPGGGDIIAFSEDPASPKTMYASVFDSGIYKSSDGGATWRDFGTNFPPLPNLHPSRNLDWGLIFQIAVSAHSGTVYVKYYGSASASGGPVYKTSDSGTTWAQLAPLPAPSTNLIAQITLDPLDDSNLYVSDSAGAVYRSQDSGATWSQVTLPATCGNSIYADVATSGKLYYASTCSGLYISKDFGGNWSLLSATSNLGAGNLYGSGFFVQAKSDPNRIYSSLADTGPLFDFYASSDGGATWTETAHGYGIGQVAIDPTNASEAYMVAWNLFGGSGNYHGLLRTADGGLSWAQLSQPPLNPSFASYGENSELVGSLAVLSTSPDVLIAQVSDHLWTITKSGTVWTESDSGLTGNWVTQIAVDPVKPTTIYTAALNFAGTSKSTDAGKSWRSIYNVLETQAIAVDPFDSSHILADDDGLNVSRDGGVTWTGGSLTSAQVIEPSTIVFDPHTQGTIYVASFLPSGGIAKSTDGGATWSRITKGLETKDSQWIWSLAIDPFDPRVLVAATNAGIYESTDAGANWTLRDISQVPFSLAFDPSHQGYVYSGGYAGLLKSTDDGKTWNSVAVEGSPWYGNLTVVVDPKSADTLFVVPTQGPSVGWSPDGGVNWFWLSNGLGQFFFGSTFSSGPVIAGTSPETLYIPSPNVGVISLVLQH